MKSLNVLVVLFLGSIIAITMPSLVMAEKVLSIHVEWGYTPPSAPAVKGFKLYQEGTAIVEWIGANISSGDTVCHFISKATNFTLTATFVDGTESPQSAPFNFIIANFISTPTGFQQAKVYPPLRSGGEKIFVPYKEGIELVKLSLDAKI